MFNNDKANFIGSLNCILYFGFYPENIETLNAKISCSSWNYLYPKRLFISLFNELSCPLFKPVPK